MRVRVAMKFQGVREVPELEKGVVRLVLFFSKLMDTEESVEI